MPISSVINFEGSQDDLVWKSPLEDFNTTSTLNVDATHEALLVVSGAAADLFGEGRHVLSVPNLPILRRIIDLPTGGETPFTCKVFYVRKVHAMDLLWGTQGPIALEDPVYHIFLHVMLRGNLSLSISDTRKFLLKLAGFRDRFSAEELKDKFRGIISSKVKEYISKFMINGQVSFLVMNAHLAEVTDAVKEVLSVYFDDYGIRLEQFFIETIEVPDKDYEMVSRAKNVRAARDIQGYSWQEEQQWKTAQTFAGNEGTMGAVGGVMAGTMGGAVMGGSLMEMLRGALSGGTPGAQAAQTAPSAQPASAPAAQPAPAAPASAPEAAPQAAGGAFCPECGSPVTPGARFCPECGTRLSRACPECGTPIVGNPKFCSNCGHKF